MEALNYDPADPDKMKLPAGLTCGDCAHIKRCKAMFGHTESDVSCDWAPSRFISKPAPVTPKLPSTSTKTIYLSPKDIADAMRAIAKESERKIMLAHVLTLNHLADLVEALACQHQNIDVYQFAADRFSGSCRDCGSDVRSQA